MKRPLLHFGFALAITFSFFFGIGLLFAKPLTGEKVCPSCTFKNFKLWGKVKVVESFPDIKVQIVESFPDLKVKQVTSFPDACGKWQFVESFPDFKVQFVTSFPDIKIKYVESFPGCN